jgi:Tfp pilus assembly protein PilO
MNYKYRWFYSVFMVISIMTLGYLYELQPLLSQIKTLRLDERGAKSQLDKLSQLAKQEAAVNEGKWAAQQHSQSGFLADLFELVNSSGLKLQSVRFAMPQEFSVMGVDMAHLTVKGGFAEISSFIFSIANQPSPILMTDFSYKSVDGSQLLMTMDILALKVNLKKLPLYGDEAGFADVHNPFCALSSAMPVSQEDAVSKMQSTLLRQIKMVGYLHQAPRSSALVQLPNSVVMEVGLGNVIGRERGIVTNVERDFMQVMLSDHSKYLMKM